MTFIWVSRLLGLTDLSNEGTFVWDSDKSETEYTYWRAGEPNNLGNNEDCVFIGHWNDLLGMTWCDMDCTYPFHGLCCPVEYRSLHALCKKSP